MKVSRKAAHRGCGQLAYFQGVLDCAAMMEAEGETVPDFEEPIATR